MKIFIILFILFSATSVYAAAPDIRISDEDGHVLDVTSANIVTITFTNDDTTITTTGGALDRRISDTDSDVLDINSDRSVTIKFN